MKWYESLGKVEQERHSGGKMHPAEKYKLQGTSPSLGKFDKKIRDYKLCPRYFCNFESRSQEIETFIISVFVFD